MGSTSDALRDSLVKSSLAISADRPARIRKSRLDTFDARSRDDGFYMIFFSFFSFSVIHSSDQVHSLCMTK